MARKRKKRADLVRVGDLYVDPKPVEHEPDCVRQNDYEDFSHFLLPRIKASRDEASKELFEYMNAGRSLSDAIGDVLMSLSTSKTRKLRTLLEQARATRIYAYARVGRERVQVGLRLTRGGVMDVALKSQVVATYHLPEDFGATWDFEMALQTIANVMQESDTPTSAAAELVREFDEVPLVEIKSKAQYDLALAKMEYPGGKWDGPGLYNFRDMPPVRVGTVEECRQAEEEMEASAALDTMFEAEEWRSTCSDFLRWG